MNIQIPQSMLSDIFLKNCDVKFGYSTLLITYLDERHVFYLGYNHTETETEKKLFYMVNTGHTLGGMIPPYDQIHFLLKKHFNISISPLVSKDRKIFINPASFEAVMETQYVNFKPTSKQDFIKLKFYMDS